MIASAVPHFFNASGAKKIELQLGQGTTEKSVQGPLGEMIHFIENANASLTLWFETSHVSSEDGLSFLILLWLTISDRLCTLGPCAFNSTLS